MKILSIIVPSYNMEKYLPKCLGSLVVAPELMDRLEVLVVNDGSKDRTSEIAHDFASKWPQTFKVIDKPNGNYGSCINAALPKCEGVFVKILDADDYFDTDAFEQFIKRLIDLQDSLPDLVLTDYDEVDGQGMVRRHLELPFPADEQFPIDRFLAAGCDIQMHAFAYRTAVLRQLKYKQLEGVSYTDTQWVRLPLLGVKTILRIPLTVYKYLVGREGQTMDAGKRAESWWMMGEVALDMLAKLPRMTPSGSGDVSRILEQRIVSIVELVYRGGIFGVAGFPAKIELMDFDRRFGELGRAGYDALSGEIYSRRLPYHYIRAWRTRSLSRLIMIPVCRLYTRMAVIMAQRCAV